MAILNKIRQRSLILILVIALALFAFVIQGVIDNPNAFSDSQGVVATVNGVDIDRNDFQQKVKNYQDRAGGRITSTQAMNAIYNQELRKIIMDNEYEALGLSVEKDEMRELLKNSFQSYPEFQDENGNFDVNRLNAFISNLKDISPDSAPLTSAGQSFNINYDIWTNNEQSIASNALQQTYYNMIKAGVSTTISEAEDDYLADAKNVDIRYVQVPYTTITDSLVEVSKSDIKAYMQAHKEKFEAEANREVVYVEFKEEASKADEDAIKADLLKLKSDRAEYNESSKNTDTIPGFDTVKDVAEFINSNSDIKYNDTFLRTAQLPAVAKDSLAKLEVGEYYGPYKDGEYFKLSKMIAVEEKADSVKVRHILIPFAGGQRADASVTKTPEEAKQTADSILAKIKSGTKFMDLLELSSDKVSNEKDGEIEFAYNAGMAPEFKAFSFDNKKGDVDVVGTSFGYHVIEILEQTSFNNTYKVGTIARKIEPSQETLDGVFNSMSKFEIAAKDGDFNKLAEERELAVKPITFKELDENMPGLGSQRQVVRWAFEEGTAIGDYKNFPISGFGFIVAKLVEKNEKGLMSVEDASITALPEIRKEKKAKMIREKITATTVDEIAKNQGQSPRTAAALTLKNTTLSGAGVEPKVIGAAFGLEQGKTSKLIDGEKGVYVIEVTKVTDATKLDNYTSIMNRLNTTLRNSVQGKVYQALEKATDIEDNRAKTVY
ncbi:SurA N-terminal domain-containing protein [Winogradskyella sp.]|jgi:parvulin-like peptidyl-prolyl isomerase|uniref:SurA N-terminal domain-containing protein n=1 Tax=Winogradskyella sp. TaxID=1883156 RepID=UPI0025EE213B|nr:SurA N-terminal domain-containing protein [Winogradskyella sp.]MCT4629938.1 SurA N-terminal domain-containing protein [Winogradskyella sp.]